MVKVMKGGKLKHGYRLARAIYGFNLRISDDNIIMAIHFILGDFPTNGTLGVWKTRARSEGVPIPDGRRKDNE